MPLTEAGREHARRVAAEAPPLTPEMIARLRAILTGCVSAQAPAAASTESQGAQGGAADAA